MPVKMDKLRQGWGATQTGRRMAAAVMDYVGTLPRRPDNWPPPDSSTQKIILEHAVAKVGPHSRTGWALADFAMTVLPGLRGDAEHWSLVCERAAISDVLCVLARADEMRSHVFTASLMQQVGEPVLREMMPKAYARVANMAARREQLLIHATERIILGVDHAEVGRMVLSHWSVHPAVIDGVGLQRHEAELLGGASPYAPVAAILKLAELAVAKEASRRVSVSELCRIASVPPEHFENVVGRARGDTETLAELVHRIRNGDSSGILPVETTEDRSDQAAWLNPLMDFASDAAYSGGPGTVARRILDCLADTLQLSGAVVFLMDRGGRSYVTSVRSDGGDVHERFPMRNEDVVGTVVPASYLGGPLLYAPPVAGPLRDRYRHRFGKRLTLMLPLTHGGETIGGVLLDEEGARTLTSAVSVEALRLMASVFATAAKSSMQSVSANQSLTTLAGTHALMIHEREEQARKRARSMMTEMAAGAAHELNNPLAVISGRAQLLSHALTDEDTKQTLELIREQCDVATEIVSDLVSVANPARPAPSFSTLKDVISGAEQRWMDRLADVGGRMLTVSGDAGVRVWVDADQLNRILDELLTNAVAWIPRENGVVQINSPSKASDETVVIVIKDNGCGMSNDVLERAFDPFYSHQLAGRRRGLGLSLARRLAENNGGSLWLESTVDVGTTAYLELPARG